MEGVRENVRLHFAFSREPQHGAAAPAGADDDVCEGKGGADACKNNGNINHDGDERKETRMSKKRRRAAGGDDDTAAAAGDKHEADGEVSGSAAPDEGSDALFRPRTIVTYGIVFSVDYGKIEPLLGVEVYAAGEHPSVAEALPMADEDDSLSSVGEENGAQRLDEKRNGCTGHFCGGGSNGQPGKNGFEEIEVSDSDDSDGGGNEADRFGVGVSWENLSAFLRRANLDFGEPAAVHFLLTFPFYEHEWDIAGFVLSTLDGEED